MQRKAGTLRERQRGAPKPSASSGEMRLTSMLPQMEQCAESKLAKGVARERRHSAELHAGQIIRVRNHLLTFGLALCYENSQFQASRKCVKDEKKQVMSALR